MISTILNEYGIKPEQCKVEPLVSGLINKTWKITCGNQAYILQRINDHVFKKPNQIAENIRMIDDYLKKNSPDYLFVSPIKNRRQEELVHHPVQGYFRLFPFIQGSRTINVVSSSNQAFEAAFQFGKFTRLLAGFDASQLHTTIPDFHNLSLRYQQYEDSLKQGNAGRIRIAKELIDDLKKYTYILTSFEKIQTNTNVKKRVMHHDTKISNVLFDDCGKGIAIIDLDTVMPGYFISDVGDMMRTYLSPANEEERDFSKIEIRDDFFRGIVHGYVTSMGDELTEAEHGLILYSGQFIIYMQAIRFLADYCNNDSYYEVKYEDNNLVRAGNQICLLKQLEEKTPVLKAIIKDELKTHTHFFIEKDFTGGSS
jgi:Ser/Thr protein kinase RdoA (MazF antagonist)